MTKQLFIETLPLSDVSTSFHELALILVIDDVIKCAYHFKLKLESNGYTESLLESQGYILSEIENNPQYSFEVFTDIMKILDIYINKYLEKDLCIIYSWDNSSVVRFMDFIIQEGLKNWEDYFCSDSVSVSSLVINELRDSIYSYEPLSLSNFSRGLLNEELERDAMSRLVCIYKLYGKLKNAKH